MIQNPRCVRYYCFIAVNKFAFEWNFCHLSMLQNCISIVKKMALFPTTINMCTVLQSDTLNVIHPLASENWVIMDILTLPFLFNSLYIYIICFEQIYFCRDTTIKLAPHKTCIASSFLERHIC